MKEKKYVVLYHSLKEKILSGNYGKEEKLPSKRMLADRTGYSVITVEKAYNMLVDEGYIEARERSGYFVCPLELMPSASKESTLHYLPEEATDRMPSSDLKQNLWFRTVRKVLAEKGNSLFIKSPSEGCNILRNAISRYLLRYRGMAADPRRIIIGSGSEQLYETAVKILGRDKIYGIETPSYPRIEAVYRAEGVSVRKLTLGRDGIPSQVLHLGGFQVLHVTPFRSYPTDITTSAAKRYQYIKWAEEGHYIVEDDFNSEFFIPGQPVESLYSMDRNQRVIYINTFSKSLSPSMRMGYMILPEALLPRYQEVLGNFSCTVPVLDQYILAEFINSGNFERHLNRMRKKMKKKLLPDK